MLQRLIISMLAMSLSYSAGVPQQTPVEKSFRECEEYSGTETGVPRDNAGNAHVIKVSTQIDLRGLNTSIRTAIKRGEKNIEVQMSQGVFYYEDLPVYLYKIDAADVSINIVGNNTVMVAGGNDYPKGNKIISPTIKNVYLDKDLNFIDPYEEVIQSKGQVEVLNTKTKECRLAVGQGFGYVPGMKVQISEWFHSPVYEVTDVKNGYLYFIANNLEYDKAKQCYNVNYDNRIGEMNPRIRMIDPQRVTKHTSSVHESTVSQFLILYKMKLKSFSIKGITFCGCAKGKNALFYFRDVDAGQIVVRDCKFEFLNDRIIKLKNAGNFMFIENEVTDCFFGALYSDIDCPGTVVKDNRFYRAERGWTNTSCVACYGEDYLITGNLFEDIGYISIATGYHHKWSDKRLCRGVIENNEIFFGEEYYSHPYKYTLTDGGAVYINTLSDKVIVRYNYIHNYRGVRSNRAIYCDDGAMNVKIYGNIISGVTNAHSVFSWRASSVNKKILQSNDGIDFYYNVIWGNYKLEERPGSSCVHGKNIIIYGKDEPQPENTLNNFAYQEKDVIVSGAFLENGKIQLPETAWNELKQLPTYEKMRKWLE